jgi:enamine deaminase RidA (YjgF/YER057c/UK114 family)
MEKSEQKRSLNRKSFDGITRIEFQHDGVTETSISAVCRENETFSDFLHRIQSEAIPAGTSIICQDIFASRQSIKPIPEINHPVTWIEPLDHTGRHLTGTQIWTIQGADVRRITLNNRIVGSIFEDRYVRYCRLGGLGTANPDLSRQIQAHNTFLEMQQLLTQTDMNFHNVIRTWFYNDRILDWYGDFNRARTQYFMDHKITLAEFPASTGIGAPNPSGSALTAGLLAVIPKSPSAAWKTVESPMQENPSEYGSSFSRAAEMETPDYRKLFISGTASISYDGQTVHTGDIYKQIELTMQVVLLILESRKMYWIDVNRALAYFKDPRFLDPWNCWCKENPAFSLPLCITHADVCREDLLFEIELDALVIK